MGFNSICPQNFERHPCFNAGACRQYARIHLPVAEQCNIRCGYCDRRYSCVNESRPGVTAGLMSPEQAAEAAAAAAMRLGNLAVVGIAGPGDPLANPEATLSTFDMVRRRLPDILLCLSTNGLALPAYAKAIADIGVSHVTVTVNAVDTAISAGIYHYVDGGDGPVTGSEAARLLLTRQKEGIMLMRSLGVVVKVNTVIIPGVNDTHAGAVAEAVKRWGAQLMNCIPLVPVRGTRFGICSEPGTETMQRVCEAAERYLPQMRHCARCRADAVGLLGQSMRVSDMLHRSDSVSSVVGL